MPTSNNLVFKQSSWILRHQSFKLNTNSLHNQYRHLVVAWVVPFALVVLVATILVQVIIQRHFVHQEEGKEERY